MWKRFINWYSWHGLQIVTGKKIFEKLNKKIEILRTEYEKEIADVKAKAERKDQ